MMLPVNSRWITTSVAKTMDENQHGKNMRKHEKADKHPKFNQRNKAKCAAIVSVVSCVNYLGQTKAPQ